MIRYLAENDEYKVYSSYEYVYLKDKSKSKDLNSFEETDINIAWHYGDPTSALFLKSGKHLIISGCGLTIYDLENKLEKNILDDPENNTWTNAIHQDELDDQNLYFRFISYFENDKLRVFKANIETLEIEMLD